MTWKIAIKLPHDRTQPGELVLTVEGSKRLTAICLGMADPELWKFNHMFDSWLVDGHTPTGVYAAHQDCGRIELTPESGDCVIAQRNGRRDLAIIDGPPGFDPNVHGGLRPTAGSIRVYDATMARIAELIEGPGVVEIEEVG